VSARRVFQAAARLGRKRDLSWIDDDLRVAEAGEIALFVGCARFSTSSSNATSACERST
jgi:hypothetical protein